MLKWIFFGIVAVVAAFLGYVAMQPPVGVITRTVVIPAPPSAVFPHIVSPKKWQEWSPWAKLDPNAEVKFEGPEAGMGAAFSWNGNSEVGAGKMTVVESQPDALIKYRLDFEKPFQNTSIAEFALKPEGSGTNVTWTMTGEQPFFARAICILMGADRMVGGMFEKGLANLSEVVAKPPA